MVQSQGGNGGMIVRGQSVLKGSFATFESCEEARLLDSKASNDPRHNQCVSIYTGQPQTVEIAITKYMYADPRGGNLVGSISFTSVEKCKLALANGMNTGHAQDQGLPAFVNRAGDANKPRFIGGCEKIEFKLCTKDSETIARPDNLIF